MRKGEGEGPFDPGAPGLRAGSGTEGRRDEVKADGDGAVFVAVYQLLEKGQDPLEPSAEIGPTVVVSFGDTRLAVGDETVVTIAGARHVGGDEESPGKRACPE